jgi:protein required for attachment to host cells
MRVRVVVANRAEARIFDAERADSPLQSIQRLTHEEARLHDRDLKSDRPGRVFDHAPQSRRGAVAHHATGGERSPRKHEDELFARRIAAEIERAYAHGQFDRLLIMAEPGFLGVMRAALSRVIDARLVAEVPKDLVRENERDLSSYVPADIHSSV